VVAVQKLLSNALLIGMSLDSAKHGLRIPVAYAPNIFSFSNLFTLYE
jgi:hypothetical protein